MNLRRPTLAGARDYFAENYDYPIIPDNVRYRAFGIDTDKGIPGFDWKTDLYYGAGHIRELIDRETGVTGFNGPLQIEQVQGVFRRYNGSGSLAEGYAQDAINTLKNAANGKGDLYFFEK